MSFHLLTLQSFPIYEQLLLEEALLRGTEHNWCLINQGSPLAIVMGISGKKEELIDCTLTAKDQIPIIKRFSGGGTVIVDESTLFVTFICNKKIHTFPAYPEPIMRWTETLYKTAFSHPDFALKENDFVIKEKKVGGNAQYIQKTRWLHHTSFLWDYHPERMGYLLHPKKAPNYRKERSHLDFLCRLKNHFENQESLINQLITTLDKQYGIKRVSLKEASAHISKDVRQSTTWIHNGSN